MVDDSEDSTDESPFKKHAALFGKTSSCAVRGATIARPEGYCMCWEREDLMMLATRDGDTNALNIRDKELDLLTRRRRRRRRELQRQVLPKVLNSAPTATAGRQQQGIELPCIQFLNMDSSHAVRMFTPPFKPAAIPAPVTVFCVGIATEDGCFVSGLNRRFELGHLYPETRRDDLIERSPICLCTDGGQSSIDSDKDMANEGETGTWDKAESFNSDDSSCDMSLEAGGRDNPGFKCACPFTGLGDAAAEAGHDDGMQSNICRGSLGPGLWHLYVAVFDGVDSRIRIDGENERVRCSFATESPTPFLDGLTIGADHTFDMSLCFGQGSDGEGEGAIAELAVFKGKLDQQDIETIERSLMSKYGIPAPTSPEHVRTDENNFFRLAHAMLSHPPGHKLFVKNKQPIPLKYMTKHRSVAWRQSNPVSGEPIRVERIGTKVGESSSDF